MMPTIDFETYSEAGFIFDPASGKWSGVAPRKSGLPAIGAYNYSRHNTTEALCLYYDMRDGAGRIPWTPCLPNPVALFDHIACGGLVEAHHAMFEYLIWNNVCTSLYGWPWLPLGQLLCSKAKARAWSLPGSLDELAKALDAIEKKDANGKRLIRLLSVPKNITKKEPYTRRTITTHPDLYVEMYQYCDQDVVTEMTVSDVIPELSPFELKVWKLDQRINARGVSIDMNALNACKAMVQHATEKYTAELIEITGGAVRTADELQAMAGWLRGSEDVDMASMDANHVKAALGSCALPDAARRVLEIRVALSSASVKKLDAIALQVGDDGRLRDLFEYCGADRSGRFSGRGPQPQNLKSGGPNYCVCPHCGVHFKIAPKCPYCWHVAMAPREWDVNAIDDVLNRIIHGISLDDLELLWGNAIDVIGSCLRGMFVGNDLICSDFSAIEAVVLAFMAGEEWRMDVFRTHGKIYEACAAKITGKPIEEIKGIVRKKYGKVPELAGGYQGWVGAWKNFGADKFMSDEEIKRAILQWRADSPMIVEMWGGQWRKHPDRWEFYHEYYGIEGAAIQAVLDPGATYSYRRISYVVEDDVLYCNLPSGRRIAYHKPRLDQGTDNYSGNPIYKLSYMGSNSDTKRGPKGWMRIWTYGGKMVENICQSVARDILAHAMLNVEAAGYPIVLHVHDEIVAEVPPGHGSVEELETIMSIMPEWCADWPVKAAGGWRGRRYRK